MTCGQAKVNQKKLGITMPAMNREASYLLQIKIKSVIDMTMTLGAISLPVKK